MVPLEEQVEGGNRGSTALLREVDVGIYVTRAQASALQNSPKRVHQKNYAKGTLKALHWGKQDTDSVQATSPHLEHKDPDAAFLCCGSLSPSRGLVQVPEAKKQLWVLQPSS